MTEDMCDATGQPCVWVSEEEYDANDDLHAWDNFCLHCGRWRDWAKEEAGYFRWLS